MTTAAESYFNWLADQVDTSDKRGKEYNELLWFMFTTEFCWMPNVRNDDNRVMDGLYLRTEFDVKFDEPCSVLEAMIALSRRMEFTVGGTAPGWAWQFILNLGFERYSDPLSTQKIEKIKDALESLVYRNYSPSGEGGFFPLQNPDEDQTTVEIWYQMAAYIDEVLPD
jgi:hypothetical protein